MDIKLDAQERDSQTKARTLRKEGWVPGCVYGKGMETLNIQVPYKTLKQTLKSHAHKLELNVGGQKFFVGIEEVQKGALGTNLDHISFHALNKNEVAALTVEMHLIGKAIGQTEGGMINQIVHEITVKGLPQDIPDMIEIDISKLAVGELFHISDIADNYKFEFQAEDMDKVIVKCAHAKVLDLGATPEVAAEEEQEDATVLEFPQGETTPVEDQKDQKKAA